MTVARQYVKTLPITNPTHKAILCYFADFAGADGVCRESHESVASDSGFSLRTIRAALASLERAGFIVRKKTRAQNGTHEIARLELVGYADFARDQRGYNERKTQRHEAPVDQRRHMPVAQRHDVPVVTAERVESLDGTTTFCVHRHDVPVATNKQLPLTSPPSSFPPTPPHITTPSSIPLETKARARGSTIAEDWSPSQADFDFALGEGLSIEQIDREAAKFLDFWVSKSGKDATKKNWSATWRNWVRKAIDDGKRGRNNGHNGFHASGHGRPAKGTIAVANELIAELNARKRDSNTSPPGPGANGSAVPKISYVRKQ